jgi:hypothetical protein
MQGRIIDHRCYFACDAPGCTAQFLSTAQVWMPAVREARGEGWRMEEPAPGKYRHFCPEHNET